VLRERFYLVFLKSMIRKMPTTSASTLHEEQTSVLLSLRTPKGIFNHGSPRESTDAFRNVEIVVPWVIDNGSDGN